MDDHYNSSPEGISDDAHLKHLHGQSDPSGSSQPGTLHGLSHTQYQSVNGASIDSPFETEDLSVSNGNHAHSVMHGEGPTPTQHQGNGVIDQHQHRLAKRLLSDTSRSTQLMSPSSALGASETRHMSQMSRNRPHNVIVSAHANGRSLPSRDVTDETIDDAYVAFILYCNPSVPLSVDSAELRRGFRAPPKSDGKSFETYKLFELIRKLERKEIKSWSQLALLLGVEPPNAEKKQSAQKVQQYAVRLKRWMHAMHLDAFFAYLIGKPHIYYSQVPTGQDLQPESARDGVPLEEDLALRALHPESRPKRGRKKAEDKDGDGDLSLSPAKRQRIDTPLESADFEGFGGEPSDLFGTNTVPSNGHNEETDPYARPFDIPWTGTPTAMTAGTLNTSLTAPSPTNRSNSGKFGGQQFRWRLNTQEGNTPTTPYPQSAITPATTHLADTVLTEPMSAITPASSSMRGRGRRRHGPAVSSAWPSGGNVLTGKFRGRPPTNRSIRDGPFTTFPANPKNREGPVIDVQRPSQASTPVTARGENQNLIEKQSSQTVSGPTGTFTQRQNQARRGGLQLQVPERSGGSVRLATPTVLVNGESGKDPGSFVHDSDDGEGESDTEEFLVRHRNAPKNKENELVRCLAHRLSKTVFVMGSSRQEYGLGRRLAEDAIRNLKYAYKDFMAEDSFIADCALWFGLIDELEIRYGEIRSTMSELRVLPADTTNTDMETIDPMNGTGAGAGAGRNGNNNNNKKAAADNKNQRFFITWKLSFGPLSANLSLPVSLPRSNNNNEQQSLAATTAGNMLVGTSGTTTTTTSATAMEGGGGRAPAAGLGEQAWKERYLRLLQEKDEEIGRMRRAVMKACF